MSIQNSQSAKPLITLIITAYNIEKYLPACLDSALMQTYPNYEIILIDDGSTDDSAKICDEYAKKSKRIFVIHQKNAGLSVARNTGIKYSKGQYIAFVDGDDLVSSIFLSRLYQSIETTSSEIAICNFVEFSEKVPTIAKASEIKTVSSNEAVISLLVKQENRDVIVCNKLYKKELFKNIQFPAGEIHEDNLTTYKLLAAASKVANIEDGLYFYRRHAGSITDTSGILLGLKMKERAANEAIKYFNNNLGLKQAAEISLLLAKFAYMDNVASGKIHNKALWRKTLEEINTARDSYKSNPYLTKKLKIYLWLTKTPGAFAYKLFRRIKH